MLKAMQRFISFIIFFTVLAKLAYGQSRNCQGCHTNLKLNIESSLQKTMSAAERGIGVLNKGQLNNYIGNYGVISHYLEYMNDACRWPASADIETQYSFGLGLVVAVKGNVITSVLGGFTEKVDWAPKDGSRGKIFSGDVTTPPPDLTPFLAMSDNHDTWPEGYFDESENWISTPGERHWPGHYRIDIDPNSSNYENEVVGEFVSDRDIYSVFDDKVNTHPDGPVGIEVEQTAYSYGRPYAEDFLIFEYIIHNKSDQHLDSVYVGYYTVFRPDYDFHDYITIVDSDPHDEHANGDFIYIWDKNNVKDGIWEDNTVDMGIIGLNVLDTPKDMGVTDFHYFNREVAPKVDERMWPVITSNPDNPNLQPVDAFFHGDDIHIDTTHPDSLKKYYPEGAPINFYVTTGPFTLEPGESVKSSMAIIMGNAGNVPDEPDTTDLMNNQRMTKMMHQRRFQGSGPPKLPFVRADSRDKEVRLVWDNIAEKSVDPLTAEMDFEGYKIYRSTDKGKTWGDPITDQFSNNIGYKPIKIYDLIDNIKGLDPVFNQSLGDDSGIKHSYVDKNLLNGVDYWYCVTSYDKGNQNPNSMEQSYQSPLGRSTQEPHTVSVIPGVQPQNYQPPKYYSPQNIENSIPAVGGLCQGVVSLDIVQPDSITGDDYVITFSDSALEIIGTDTNFVLGFNLDRISKKTGITTRLLERHVLSNETEDNLPIIDGFRLTLLNSPSGAEFIGWTKVNGDTCTYDWYTEKRTTNFQEIWEEIRGFSDYKIVIVDTSESITALMTDGVFGRNEQLYINIPVKAYNITDPENPIDISEYTQIIDIRMKHKNSELLGPLGWDLIPGGKGYNPTGAGNIWTDVLCLYTEADTTKDHIWIKTQNGPATATAPSIGDEFVIKTFKPFREEIRYEFCTTKAEYSTLKNIDLNKIRVVPDPYIISNAWETSQFGKKLMFNHLPHECTISIYTVAGDHVRTLEHDDNRGFEFWDMRTYNDQFIAYGMYVYVVSIPNGQKKVGKFLVIK